MVLAPLSRTQLEHLQQETNVLVRVIEASEASGFEYWHLYNSNPSTDKQQFQSKMSSVGVSSESFNALSTRNEILRRTNML